jgi:hypothetical protein
LITDTAGAFGAAGTTLPNLVLAISRNGAGATAANYNVVALGGVGAANPVGGTAGLILDNGVTGAFRAAAVDNLPSPAIPAGDVITVTATLTGYADPASFTTLDITNQNDLLALTGPLPGISFVDTTAAIPEPASLVMSATGLLGVLGYSVWSRRRKRRADTD